MSEFDDVIGWDELAVFLSDYSALIPPDKIKILNYESQQMFLKGAARYVMCGPVYDTNGKQQVTAHTHTPLLP